jgi:CRP/FNR family transcriptional regulator, anaerobic regulatory protein
MTPNFITFIGQITTFTNEEIILAEPLFIENYLKKGEFWIKEGEFKDDLLFINKGLLRAFFMKNEIEKTFDLITENQVFTSANCYSLGVPSRDYIQAVEDTHFISISKENLEVIFTHSPKWERAGRIIAEFYTVEQEDRIRSFIVETAQERYENLAKNRPELIQRTPQIYLANYLGITPQSLSRLRRNIVTNHG